MYKMCSTTKTQPWKVSLFSALHRGCQIFLGIIYQNGEIYTKLPQNIPNYHKIYQMVIQDYKLSYNIPNVHKIFRMAIQYINIFQSRALQNLPKLGIFGLKRNHLATLPQGRKFNT
jgi:hypothetical protein